MGEIKVRSSIAGRWVVLLDNQFWWICSLVVDLGGRLYEYVYLVDVLSGLTKEQVGWLIRKITVLITFTLIYLDKK